MLNLTYLRDIKGFTLVEIMVVITIIALVGAVVGPRVFNQLSGAKTKAARLQIEDYGSALELFYLETGRYPASSEGLSALIKAPPGLERWNGPYLKKTILPRDPWDNDYYYQSPGEHGEYDLYSYGKDGKPGGDGENSDIVSWE